MKRSNRKSWVQLFLDPIIPKANPSLYNEKWLGVLPPLKELLGNHKNTFPLPFPSQIFAKENFDSKLAAKLSGTQI